MGKLADLNMPTREGNLRNPERLNQRLRDIGDDVKPLGRLATEGLGQVLLGDDGTIPWYMSLAPGADLTDKLMEGRQPGLLDVPGPGTLAKIAMLPVMKFGAKEVLEGTARMGKSARNLERTRDARNYVTRFHRTETKNVPSIQQSGLKLRSDNPNYGTNTRDSDHIEPVVWLGVSSKKIPVLRNEYLNNPDNVSQFEVKIPKDEYYSLPRMMFDNGRGYGKPHLVEKGKSSLTDEGNYKIDMIASEIPPEYLRLTDIPKWDVGEDVRKHYDKARLATLLVNSDDDAVSRLPRRLRNEAEKLVESTYDLEEALGVDNMINDMYTPKHLSELLQVVGENPSDKTLKSAAKYLMEGTEYAENPADELLDRVKLNGGLIPYPGNGKRFEIVDASKFEPHRGLVSRGEDYGESFDGIGYTNAIKSATDYDMKSPEAHKEFLKRNYEALMNQ